MNPTQSIQTDETIDDPTSLPWEIATVMEKYLETISKALRKPACPRCFSPHGQWQGYRKTTRHGVLHRMYCKSCKLRFAITKR